MGELETRKKKSLTGREEHVGGFVLPPGNQRRRNRRKRKIKGKGKSQKKEKVEEGGGVGEAQRRNEGNDEKLALRKNP